MPPIPPQPFAAIAHRQEQFSGAYIRAICAACGCSVDAMTQDNDKIDFIIKSRVVGTVRTKPQIDIQVKCRSSGAAAVDPISYSIDLATYDGLRDPLVVNPRLLVLVLVPEDVNSWLTQSELNLSLKHCAYWVSLRGSPDSENAATQTIYFPRLNVFSADALVGMMQQTANGQDIS